MFNALLSGSEFNLDNITHVQFLIGSCNQKDNSLLWEWKALTEKDSSQESAVYTKDTLPDCGEYASKCKSITICIQCLLSALD